MSALPETTIPPRITVVFLLYNAGREVKGLLDSLRTQRHPLFAEQSDWLEAIFMDDASHDDTVRALEAELRAVSSPSHYRVALNPRNLGLAATLNRAFALARAPYVLTCHLDCRFGQDGYAAAMLDLLERHPRVAAITGRPAPRDARAMPFPEKLNVITNLMDILPAATDEELVPVGFAEGRCDAFRLEALRAVGFYDATLRTAGEDQVLAAKLRAQGYLVCQAPRLVYGLSVSGEQDTVWRLARHQWLFGLAHPTILLRTRGAGGGVLGEHAGRNRRARALLRLVQVVATGATLAAAVLLVTGEAVVAFLVLLVVLVAKLALFARHLREVPLSPVQHVSFWLVQPLLDGAYTCGLMQGLLRALGRGSGRPIG